MRCKSMSIVDRHMCHGKNTVENIANINVDLQY